MDAPLTATDPIPLPFPEPARARRWPAAITSVLTALIVNVLILASFLFVTVHERRGTPPTIFATTIPTDPEPPVDPPKPDHPQPAAPSGGAPASFDLTIASSSMSALSLTLSDLPSFDNGVSGLEGIGNSFGSGFGSGGTGTGGASMKIGKITVKAKTLGLILDVSGSMESHLPKVKREVRKAFKDAKTVEVEGCRLDWTEPAALEGDEKRQIKLKSEARSVIEAVEMLVGDGRADAIYWFSDLQDGETEAGLARLRDLLKLERGKARAVKFYIRSLGQEPSPKLAVIVKASGGAVQAGEKGE
jgi:hypothetical protein